MRQVTRLGNFPAEATVVHVGDRGADMFPFCRGLSSHADPFSGASGGRIDGSSQKRNRTRICSMRCEPGKLQPADRFTCLAVMDEQLARLSCSSPMAR
jgi:hypothetical protein